MLKTFGVQNFRVFSYPTIEPLGLVNLITGKNNVGKTSLLEALWVHHGSHNPDLAHRLGAFRGVTAFDTYNILEDLFRDLNNVLVALTFIKKIFFD